jgi:hypothetical protein
MTPTASKQTNDPDIHKGAIEADRPSQEQNTDKTNGGVDKDGMPNDPKATTEDREGANADENQG